MAKIRVLVADDHAVLRAGLKLLINQQPDMEVVAEAGCFNEALRLGKATKPDVISLDLTMPGGAGVDMVERICRECAPARVLILTMHDDLAYLRAALSAGACGYVVKKAADSELLGAIRAVHQGRAFVDLDLRGRQAQSVLVSKSTDKAQPPRTPNDDLSDRERAVLQLLAQGYTNQAVADQLELSVKTIESYRSRLLRKLGLHTRVDITRYAVESGLLRPTGPIPPTAPHS